METGASWTAPAERSGDGVFGRTMPVGKRTRPVRAKAAWRFASRRSPNFAIQFSRGFISFLTAPAGRTLPARARKAVCVRCIGCFARSYLPASIHPFDVIHPKPAAARTPFQRVTPAGFLRGEPLPVLRCATLRAAEQDVLNLGPADDFSNPRHDASQLTAPWS